MFGTLIALLHNGQPVLGIIDQPITRERWVGVSGAPSTLNGKPIATRACGNIGNAYMYATTPHMFAGATEEVGLLSLMLTGCAACRCPLLLTGPHSGWLTGTSGGRRRSCAMHCMWHLSFGPL